MAQPEDWESPARRCSSCGEYVPKDEAAFHEGEHFHPDCRPDLDRCCWCGRWSPKAEVVLADDGDLYHRACIREIRERAGKGAES
jgi:hypothetical protein